jgi:hypothetical protein
MAHIVEDPVLQEKNAKTRVPCQTGSSCSLYRSLSYNFGQTGKYEYELGPNKKYHSSVSHVQGRSYFKMNDGSVCTAPNRRPANTQNFNWYGVFIRSLLSAIAHVRAIKRFSKRPTAPIPLLNLHMKEYSSSV